MKISGKSLILMAVLLCAGVGLVAVGLPVEFEADYLAGYLSSFAGFTGAALLLVQICLGLPSIASTASIDRTVVLRAHKNLAIYGFLLIALHPILSAYDYGESILYSIVPDFSGRFETYASLGRVAFIALTLVWVSSALLREKIKYRKWHYLHYLSYIILPLVFIHGPGVGGAFDGAMRYLWPLMIGLYAGVLAARILSLSPLSRIKYQIISNAKVTDGIYRLRLAPATGDFIDFNPGQYAYLQANPFGEEHPFSIVAKTQKGGLEFIYKSVGKFTAELPQLKKGRKVYVGQPQGDFTTQVYQNPDVQSVFIAGGIGITPFLDHCLNHPKNKSLFYLHRNQNDGIYSDQLEKSLRNEFHEVLSDIGEPSSQKFDAQLVVSKVEDQVKAQYFICGPPGMMEDVADQLRSLGVKDEHIHTEEFSF